MFIDVEKNKFISKTDQQLVEVSVHSGWRVIQREVEEMIHCDFALRIVIGVDSGHRESAVGVREVVMADAATKAEIGFIFLLFIGDIGHT